MGFFEDDRIRAKNVIYNEAWGFYESFRFMKYSDLDIERYINLALDFTSDSYRINIYQAVLQIVRRSNEDIDDGGSNASNI